MVEKKGNINRFVIYFTLFVIAILLRIFVSGRIPDDVDESLIKKHMVNITSISINNNPFGYSTIKISVDHNGKNESIVDGIPHSEYYKLKLYENINNNIEVYSYHDKLYYKTKNIMTPARIFKSILFIWFPLTTFYLTIVSIYIFIIEKRMGSSSQQ